MKLVYYLFDNFCICQDSTRKLALAQLPVEVQRDFGRAYLLLWLSG